MSHTDTTRSSAPVTARCRRSVAALASLVLNLLRELADENAYERHLRAHGRPHSGEEWRRFTEERLRARYVRPRCC